jgi:hypothetical protein
VDRYTFTVVDFHHRLLAGLPAHPNKRMASNRRAKCPQTRYPDPKPATLHETGASPRLLKSLARVELLILDDWGLAPLTSQQGRDLLEIVDDRHGRGSTIVTSQLPVDHWHEVIVEPTLS